MENRLYTVLSCLWRNTVLKYYRGYLKNKELKYWEERIKHFGWKNRNKTFYVIRRRDAYCGIFSIYMTTLARIDEALKNGFIPVIDMQNSFNIYLNKKKIGKENAWEYYFEQPMGYTLSDINKSKNVIIGSGAVPQMFPYLDVSFLLGKTGDFEYWKALAKKYLRINDKVKEYAEKERNRLFSKDEKILGVKCRGTDYIKECPKNHPIQPGILEIINESERIFKEYNCNKIFLVTEDREYYEAFQKKFGEVLVIYEDDFVDYKEGSVGKALYEQSKNMYEEGLKYLTTTLLLSGCNCLCAGCVSATVGALLMTEGYEYLYLFDLGIY